ncbi:deoxyribodipyrimidine photolyase [bacterium]|nr:deoxyribodipyrimidine photolyase [bacterium]
MRVPELRIQALNNQPLRSDRSFVLYWMTASRRVQWNFGLQRAVELAVALGRPLVILEALRVGYPWASDRLHRFVLQGMAENRRRLRGSPVRYYCYVELGAGHGAGLLEALANQAAVVVTDDYPCFFLPRMQQAVASRLYVRLEAVDSNGLLPMRAASQVFPTAYAFRRFLQKRLPEHLNELPDRDPLAGVTLPPPVKIDTEILQRWPEASDELLAASPEQLAKLPIDHSVGPGLADGGASAAKVVLRSFLTTKLHRYPDERNQPEADVSSGLSPWLHFGHLSTHQIFVELAQQEDWHPGSLSASTKGSKAGWWGMSEAAEAFLDELITWREVGFNMCWQRPDYDRYESLPEWAQATLAEHEGDTRQHVYSRDEFEQAATHDELWNSAQNQLLTEGRMHNYLRMLWGKKILEWSATPRDALDTMIHLNNKYALDGRDPNSYSGIFWVLGRYDRAWGPERPIFGTIRFMSSQNTARKVRVRDYIEQYRPRLRGQQTLW